MNFSFLKYNWPSLLWAAFILWLCLVPGTDLPSFSIWQADKIAHVFVYVVLAMLTFLGWKKQTQFPLLKKHLLLKLLGSLVAYGFAVEVLQELLTTDRVFDLYDAISNGIGALIGSVLSHYFLNLVSVNSK